MLEDESGRLRLIGDLLANEMLVTGCVIAVMGTENANGDFEVVDIRVPDLPPQPVRWASSNSPIANNGSGRKLKKLNLEDENEDKNMKENERGGAGKLAIVSGLGISGISAERSLQINLLLE